MVLITMLLRSKYLQSELRSKYCYIGKKEAASVCHWKQMTYVITTLPMDFFHRLLFRQMQSHLSVNRTNSSTLASSRDFGVRLTNVLQ